ncbi:hypothetical protein IZ6_18450 [Terrihabitans soli]|uniref:Porin n=1 Tax=Terrihabitans soli TaxID=708113 RepID=A0A6S6QVR2_9HYPH|nr:hypothetical protein [Terrihabitans soli]BCJ91110.1 hypothetical protein IZ6_18450 [Terrihabitans soli]
MHSSRLIAAAMLMLAAPALAQEANFEALEGLEVEAAAPEPEFNCDQKDVPGELALLCLGLDVGGYQDAMSRPAEITGKGRPDIKPSLARRPITEEITGRGLAAAPADPLRKDPFAGPEDRGIGMRVRADGTPVQFSTEMVQPGMAGDTVMNWELKAETSPQQSGLFYGGAAAGTYNPESPGGMSETLSGFAGLRSVMKPADNVQIGAEIAPRFGMPDYSVQQGSLAFEPKLSARSDLGRLGTSDFVGSINADAGYSVPVNGDPAAWGGMRLTVKPK